MSDRSWSLCLNSRFIYQQPGRESLGSLSAPNRRAGQSSAQTAPSHWSTSCWSRRSILNEQRFVRTERILLDWRVIHRPILSCYNHVHLNFHSVCHWAFLESFFFLAKEAPWVRRHTPSPGEAGVVPRCIFYVKLESRFLTTSKFTSLA